MTNPDPSPDHPSRARDLFLEVIDLSPAERPLALDRLCADAPGLRAEVEALLRAAEHASADNFMASPTAWTLTSRREQISEGPGSVIGPYKLLQFIGEGGFGVVFLAEQQAPIRRKVALKIIKPGMDSKAVVARFEAERQALALMNHPHIARVYDGGITDPAPTGAGRPYFVMEYVVGDPITKFADAHKLDLRARLELLTQVCQAVQHAHTKGLIHRDLKPANVLVSMVDGKPFAKVIDFGIAKSLASPLTEKTLFTEHRQLIGTPEYMSPEQAEGTPDIDTRTDVYALGVLLYELLTGLTPFDSRRLRSAAFDEMRRIIKDEDPPLPSQRISRSLPALAALADRRQVEPARLGALLQGELDWIVMKSLEKDRARRYETPNQLAADMQRYLTGEAVVAAPPSAGYRLRKFVRRHKAMVTGGTAVGVAILLGAVGTTWGWHRAQAESKRNQRIATLTGDVLDDIVSDIQGLSPTFTDLPTLNALTSAQAIDAESKLEGIKHGAGYAFGYIAGQHEELKDANTRLLEMTNTAEWSAYTANLALAQAAMDAGNWPEARERLRQCPESKRGWEWRLLDAQAQQVLCFIQTECDMVAVSPDGALVAASWADPQPSTRIQLWSGTTGEFVRDLVTDEAFTLVGFGADGKTVITRPPSDHRDHPREGDHCRIWDLATGQCRSAVPCEPMCVVAFQVSPDQRTGVVGYIDGTISIWDLSDLKLVRSFRAPGAGLYDVALSADSRRVVTSSDDASIRLWDCATGQLVREFPGVLSGGNDVFLADGDSTLIAVSRWGPVQVWDAASGALRSAPVPRDRRSWTNLASGLLGGRIFVGEWSGGSLYDAATGALHGEFYWKEMAVCSIAESERGNIAAVAVRPGWSDINAADAGILVVSSRPFSTPVRRMYRGASDRPDSRDVLMRLRMAAVDGLPPPEVRQQVLTTPDGSRRVSCDEGRVVRFTDAATNREVASIDVGMKVIGLQVTSDGTRLALALSDEDVLVWDIRDAKSQKEDYARAWIEHTPATAYLDTLLAGPTPTPALYSVIEADPSLTALRRWVAAELLDQRLDEMRDTASRMFETMTPEQTDKAAVLAAAQAADLPPRIKEMVLAQAAAWTYAPPPRSAEADLAEEAGQRRLAQARLALTTLDAGASEEQLRADRDAVLDALRTFRELSPSFDETTYEQFSRAFETVAVGDARYVWAEAAYRASDLSWALTSVLEAIADRAKDNDAASAPGGGGQTVPESPCEFAVLAMIRASLAGADEETAAAASRTDQKMLGRSLSRAEQIAAAREALAKAHRVFDDPEARNASGRPWSEDPDAKALLAEADRLLNAALPATQDDR
ncbi:MAG: protein kinase [Phycisphaerales bacterium]|nr:protein kinase [Phycisphaerales bacterium]